MSSPYPCKVCGLYFHYEEDMYACRSCYHHLKLQEYNSPSHWKKEREEEWRKRAHAVKEPPCGKGPRSPHCWRNRKLGGSIDHVGVLHRRIVLLVPSTTHGFYLRRRPRSAEHQGKLICNKLDCCVPVLPPAWSGIRIFRRYKKRVTQRVRSRRPPVTIH